MDIPCVAADGKTKVYGAGHVGSMPLMVRATDFNALHAECVRLRGAVMSGEGEWVGHKELAALRKDAERYRWLCANNFDKPGVAQVHCWLQTWEPHSETGEPTEWTQRIRGGALDRVIDEAMDAARAVGAA